MARTVRGQAPNEPWLRKTVLGSRSQCLAADEGGGRFTLVQYRPSCPHQWNRHDYEHR